MRMLSATIILAVFVLSAQLVFCYGGIVENVQAAPVFVDSWEALNNTRLDLTGDYVLTTNLDSGSVGYDTYAGPLAHGGQGWMPIGTPGVGNTFRGTFDGQNYTISDLYINRPTTTDVGFFGTVGANTIIRNLNLLNVDILGRDNIGGLAGFATTTNIENVLVTGEVSGNTPPSGNATGGLVGQLQSSTINNVRAECIVTGNNYIGGLVGYSVKVGGVQHNIYSAHTDSTIIGNIAVGGFIGLCLETTITNSSSNGTVEGTSYVGGFVGATENVVGVYVYSNSSARVDVQANNAAGGFVGYMIDVLITDCYARGNVTRNVGEVGVSFGGFVGFNNDGKIFNGYSIGRVSYDGVPDPTDKGFCGETLDAGNYEMARNFWDTDTSQQSTTHGEATGRTTAQMMQAGTYRGVGWDLQTMVSWNGHLWMINESTEYPVFRWELEDWFTPTIVRLTPRDDQIYPIDMDLVFLARAWNRYGWLITNNPTDFVWENATDGVFYESAFGTYTVRASYAGVGSNSVEIETVTYQVWIMARTYRIVSNILPLIVTFACVTLIFNLLVAGKRR